jgi:ABC-type transporter Mla MlaB component
LASADVSRGEMTALLARVRPFPCAGSAGMVVCDLGGWGRADLGTVDALARLHLLARRRGRRLRLRQVPPELADLIRLTGLAGVLVGSEARRQSEQREQPVDLQEGVEPDDAPAGDLQDLQRPRRVPAVGAAPVLPERRTAVGHDGQQA